jgi:hypothetical protein
MIVLYEINSLSNTFKITIDIYCLPIINVQALSGNNPNYNEFIFKWLYNDFDYGDTYSTASNDFD